MNSAPATRFLLVALAYWLNLTNVIAAPGDLDSSFGMGGAAALHTTLPMGRPDAVTPPGRLSPYGFAQQPDGKIVSFGAEIGGDCHACQVVVRMNSDGSPDMGFGNGGFVVTDMGPLNSFYNPTEVVFQPDGRIIVSGYGDAGSTMVRYMPNGNLDSSFGTGGKAASSILTRSSRVLVQPDGSILMFGTQGECGVTASQCDGSFIRFTAAGQLDTNFGSNGVLTLLTVESQAAADLYRAPGLSVLSDGSYLVDSWVSAGACNRATLRRFTTTFQPDLGFGYNGAIYVLPSLCLRSASLVPMADGRFILVAEPVPNGNTSPSLVLLRYQANGSYDMSFGTQGTKAISVPSLPNGSVLSPHGLSFTSNAQTTLVGNYLPTESTWFGSSFLMRLNADGSPDASFGTSGLVLFGHRADAYRFTNDGKVIAGFPRPDRIQYISPWAMARYLVDAVPATGPVPGTGLWAVVSELNGKPGRGFSVDVQHGTLVLVEYGYEANGRGSFYLGTGPLYFGSTGGNYFGPLSEPTLTSYAGGMAFGDQPKSAHALSTVSFVVQFDNAQQGWIRFPGEEWKEVTKFRYGSGPTTISATSPAAGLWAIESEIDGRPGRGFAVDVQGNTLVLTVYAYDALGNSNFYQAVGPIDSNGSFTGDLTYYSGGTHFGGPAQTAAAAGTAGTVRIRFVDPGDQAFITLPNESTKLMRKFNF
jgi:uncharacterized delta-60 repeat protein